MYPTGQEMGLTLRCGYHHPNVKFIRISQGGLAGFASGTVGLQVQLQPSHVIDKIVSQNTLTLSTERGAI